MGLRYPAGPYGRSLVLVLGSLNSYFCQSVFYRNRWKRRKQFTGFAGCRSRYQRHPVEGGSVEDSRHREDKLCQEHCNGINGKLSTPSLEGWPLRTRRWSRRKTYSRHSPSCTGNLDTLPLQVHLGRVIDGQDMEESKNSWAKKSSSEWSISQASSSLLKYIRSIDGSRSIGVVKFVG